MGTPLRSPEPLSVADALFTPVQQRTLAVLFGQPDRAFGTRELIRLAGSGGAGAVQRQLARLERVGLVVASRVGNQKLYQANREAPAFPELHGLVVKTVAVVEPLRAALEALGGDVEVAFVFGSVAKGGERSTSDLDLMVLSETLSYPQLLEALGGAQLTLGRAIDPKILRPAEWRRRRGEVDSFVARIDKQPKLFVIGDERALA